MNDQKDRLFVLCEQFIQDQDIICAESIYQTDRVIENALDFIHEVCLIVGYARLEDLDD